MARYVNYENSYWPSFGAQPYHLRCGLLHRLARSGGSSRAVFDNFDPDRKADVEGLTGTDKCAG